MYSLNEYEYYMSRGIPIRDWPFYALIATAMRQADAGSLEKLKAAFPEIYESLIEWRENPMWPVD